MAAYDYGYGETMMQWLRYLLSGMAMGTADMIPGVSGGTMAWVLGVYERLIGLLSRAGAGWLKLLLRAQVKALARALDLGFIIPLMAGIVAAMVLMVKVVNLPELMRAHPEPVYGLFFGLIAGSVWLLLRGQERPNMPWLYALIGAGVGVAVVNLVPADTPDADWFLFLCGALAISAMLLPGISGSFILLILGKYTVILTAIGDANLGVLLPFLAGCGVGLIVFSRLLSYALKHCHAQMVWLMGGLLMGTLWAIWPFQQREYVMVRGKEKLMSSTPVLPDAWDSPYVLLSLGLMVLGLIIVMAMQRLARKA